MKLHLLPLILPLVSCGSRDPITVNKSYSPTEQDAYSYFLQAQDLLGTSSHHINLHVLTVAPPAKEDGITLGQCEYKQVLTINNTLTTYYTILIPQPTWDLLTDNTKLFVMAHEYMHCGFNKLHNNLPNTLMYPYIPSHLLDYTYQEVIDLITTTKDL
jgi:hypothetical protein